MSPRRALPLPDDDVDLDRELARRGLREFAEIAFPQVQPSESFVDGWHIDAICEHLEAVARRDINRLIINVPPGAMKSLLVSVFFPAWTWTFDPGHRWIFASYSSLNSQRDSLKTRRLVESAWFQNRWGHVFARRRDRWGAMKFENDKGGFRLATSTTGTVTGEHAHTHVLDDLVKPKDAGTGLRMTTETELNKAADFMTQTLSSRFVDKETGARVVVMQRLHENDPTGVALEAGGYVHLKLPMRFHADRRCRTIVNGFEDPRTKEGELLWRRFTEAGVDTEARELGPRGTAAQHDQEPVPPGGTIIHRDWIKTWEVLPANLRWVQSWDFAFKDLDSSDPIAGHAWGASADGNFYLGDRTGGVMGFNASCEAMLSFSGKHPLIFKKLVEDKANGPAVENMLQGKIPGIELVSPHGGKETRLLAVEPLFFAGRVFFPPPSRFPWVHDLIEQVVKFGAMKHDDDVDAMTQALIHLYGKHVGLLAAAMANVRRGVGSARLPAR